MVCDSIGESTFSVQEEHRYYFALAPNMTNDGCRESVVDIPGCPLKCVLGRRLCFSRIYNTLSAISTENNLAVVFRRVIGLYALGAE